MADRTPTSPSDVAPAQNLVAVASGKGGVGKTWFAITLSHAIARAGRRALLFDGDLGLANVDIQLGLMPERDLAAVIGGRIGLKQSVTRYAEGGFDIIAGRSGTGNLASLPLQRLTALRNALVDLAQSYDRVILDLGAGVDRTVKTMAGAAGTSLVITNDEPTSITDAYAFLKLTYAERPDADLRVVVNMAESRAAGERTYETLRNACRNFLKREPALGGIVRSDRRIRETIRHQAPLLARHPNTDAAEDVEAIARRLLED